MQLVTAMRRLVAEDERFVADLVADGLRERTMAVDVVYDGAVALERLAVNDYDVLVLDRDLPGVHGDDVSQELTRRGHLITPISGFSGAMGNGEAVMHDAKRGVNFAGSDPRTDGAAIPEQPVIPR